MRVSVREGATDCRQSILILSCLKLHITINSARMKLAWKENWPVYLIFITITVVMIRGVVVAIHKPAPTEFETFKSDHWEAPSLYIDGTDGFDRQELIYGEDLIAHTSRYFGPNGSVAQISNGMNCQNCHLQAGTKAWGNNYGAVFATYPKFRERSGSVESISKRVNDCITRSLNGGAIDSTGKEMKAMIVYISWVGSRVTRGVKPVGSGIRELSYLNRAANPEAGAVLYSAKCQRCHGSNGEGVRNALGYEYPPLWGVNSFNSGAGLLRLSKLAGFIKDNMPFNEATHEQPVLRDAEAWDLAGFICSQPRPQKDLSHDWPDISKKPFDHPYGPYTDGFSQLQHQLGPYRAIIAARKK